MQSMSTYSRDLGLDGICGNEVIDLSIPFMPM